MPNSCPHSHLDSEAQSHWIRHLAAAEDAGIEPEDAVNVLLCAAAMAWAHVAGWGGEDRVIPNNEIAETAADFELVVLKTLADIAPSRLSDASRGRMEVLDRDIKRRRGIPIEGGTA